MKTDISFCCVGDGLSGKYAAIVWSKDHVFRPKSSLSNGHCSAGDSNFSAYKKPNDYSLFGDYWYNDLGKFTSLLFVIRLYFDFTQLLKSVQARQGFSPVVPTPGFAKLPSISSVSCPPEIKLMRRSTWDWKSASRLHESIGRNYYEILNQHSTGHFNSDSRRIRKIEISTFDVDDENSSRNRSGFKFRGVAPVTCFHWWVPNLKVNLSGIAKIKVQLA